MNSLGARNPKEAKRMLEEMFSIIWLNEILELSASIERPQGRGRTPRGQGYNYRGDCRS